MWERRLAVVATAALLACPAQPAPQPPQNIDDTALRIRIAQAEARRGNGFVELIELATHGATKHERLLALRGLGRIGGPAAYNALAGALRDSDPEVVGVAATAIGIATSLDEDDAGTPAITSALVEALPRAKGFEHMVIEAIGRAANASAQSVLVKQLEVPALRTAAAIAIGRYGRRKIELEPAVRQALVAQLDTKIEPATRHAIAWALAREQLPPRAGEPAGPPPVTFDIALTSAALAKLLADDTAEVRAQAASALGRRKVVKRAQQALIGALGDRDWRVAVEVVRALTGDGDDAAQVAVATSALARFDRLEGGEVTEAHVIIEALVGLAPHAEISAVTKLVEDLARRAGASTKASPLARSWIECRAIVVTMRSAATPDYAAVENCGHGKLPDHLRLPLIAELVTAKVGSVAARRTALRTLLAHTDARVRVTGMAALAALWPDGEDADHRAAIATVIGALGSSDPIVAGNAVDAATAIYEAVKTSKASRGPEILALDAALVARAGTEKEPELAGALFELIGKQTIASGQPACRGGLVGAPVLARAAAACLKALGDPVPAVTIGAATPPPLEVAQVIGRKLRWNLMTTRGDIVIELRPDIAPWAVAAIVTLTRKGFYDGLELHRVVPNFVAQGGDPSQSGWGGPGFTIPAEPSTGSGYVVGGVGIADSGRDSGGSQWFVMHSGAPHLDGRYTWIGSVASGQKSADALLIGDKVTRAIVEVVGDPQK